MREPFPGQAISLGLPCAISCACTPGWCSQPPAPPRCAYSCAAGGCDGSRAVCVMSGACSALLFRRCRPRNTSAPMEARPIGMPTPRPMAKDLVSSVLPVAPPSPPLLLVEEEEEDDDDDDDEGELAVDEKDLVVEEAVDVAPGALLMAVKMSMSTTSVPLQQL